MTKLQLSTTTRIIGERLRQSLENLLNVQPFITRVSLSVDVFDLEEPPSIAEVIQWCESDHNYLSLFHHVSDVRFSISRRELFVEIHA